MVLELERAAVVGLELKLSADQAKIAQCTLEVQRLMVERFGGRKAVDHWSRVRLILQANTVIIPTLLWPVSYLPAGYVVR